MEIAGALLTSVVTLLLASIKSSIAYGMAKPECQETCGNLTIPYPFGIGTGCYREGFKVACENNTAFRNDPTSRMKIYSINLLGGQVRQNTLIASKCFNMQVSGWASLITGYRFTISNKANKLTAVGCNTHAFLGGSNSYMAGAACYSMCTNNRSVDLSGRCSGMGCCHTSIAPQLTSSNITFDDRFNNSAVSGFNPCSYAFVSEQDWFKFDPSYLEGDNFTKENKDGVVTVMDWVAGKESCVEAVKNTSSYACISKNGRCMDSSNATGYICTCSDGFAGNPYLEEGCKDINECQVQYPCKGICTNTFGSYNCSCPPGTNSTDPTKEDCKPISDGNNHFSDRANQTKVFAGNLPVLQTFQYISQNIVDKSD